MGVKDQKKIDDDTIVVGVCAPVKGINELCVGVLSNQQSSQVALPTPIDDASEKIPFPEHCSRRNNAHTISHKCEVLPLEIYNDIHNPVGHNDLPVV
ncbi:hypothetical protein J6590_041645 [Homalodisca vitripennis]|nr:hypothetical protein J6590_041645 [Homalodisca vitripennis]